MGFLTRRAELWVVSYNRSPRLGKVVWSVFSVDMKVKGSIGKLTNLNLEPTSFSVVLEIACNCSVFVMRGVDSCRYKAY